MKKIDLIQKLKQLDGISQDEKAYLINLVNTKKKYGLVWEDKIEDVEEQLRENLPLLKEVKDKAIINGEDLPNHILIEGDNLHALTALTFTHEGKIDVIYIDPPYNTGNKDFKYNDTFVDREDSFRHSKWLSFMSKRLEIAKRLLSDKGVIFISIDDNEQAQLKMLCDEVFTENCFVGDIIWRSSDNSNNDAKQFSQDHNYTLIYSKSDGWIPNKVDRTEEQSLHYKNNNNDPRGPWFDGNPISSPSPRLNLCYDLITPSGNVIKPPKNGWRWSRETMGEKMESGEIFFNENQTNIKRKTYLIEQEGLPPSSLWVDLEQTGHNRQAKYELMKIFSEKSKAEVFTTPKPVKLITRILEIGGDKTATVLDFFAGSGTMLQSCIQLNAIDNGNRKCIMVTNNENNICEDITYERGKRIINGYQNNKKGKVIGFTNNNLRYYKSEFISRDTSIKNKKEITKLATELLCIKEDIYTAQHKIGDYELNAKYAQCFKQDNLYLLVIYDVDMIEQMVEVIENAINETDKKLHFKVYVFSNGQYPYTEEFENVLEHITLCALPDAIYKAYQNVLPKRQRKIMPELEEQTAEDVEIKLDIDKIDLFNQR